jgi:zinc protease
VVITKSTFSDSNINDLIKIYFIIYEWKANDKYFFEGIMPDTVLMTTLTNGMTVRMKEIHTAPIISHWLWYRVGSRNEGHGRTGISHWVEHMQFKGTPAFPASMLDKAISREGGVWNAMTYLDWTTFFETLPAAKIDLGLRLEADRMINSVYDPDEVSSERTVIISEREGSENEPLFRLGEAIHEEAFSVHPYRHEVLGYKTDLQSMQRDDLYQHYQTYYRPNNTVLAIAGDFDSNEMLARVKMLYEGIPPGDLPVRPDIIEPIATSEKRVKVEGPGETTYVQVAFHAPEAANSDFFSFSVLDSLLSGPSGLNMFGGGGISNKTSRLYRALVEKELAVHVHGGISATIDPYLYGMTIMVHPQKTPEDVIEALEGEIKRLQDQFVSPEEIARAIKQAKAMFAYGSENITNQAFWLGYAEMFANYDWFTHYVDQLAVVTPADVQQIAQDYLLPQNRVIGIYLPTNHGGEAK